jgi:BioD-like phosphotransacetylase family protein
LALNASTVEEFLTDMDEEELKQKLLQAFAQASEDREITILEGAGDLAEGSLAGLSAREVADLFQAQTLVVAKFSRDLVVDDLLLAGEIMGPRLMGTVINSVPPMRQDFTAGVVKPFLERRGIQVLAVLPEESVLSSTSVREIADCLGGQVLCCEDRVEELVEHLMVGAMSSEHALTYFRRRPNKAVITGGDRPDIQLAALQTSTKCLVLTGNLYPSSVILGHAEEAGVPIILVGYDTLTTVEMLQQFFGRTRFHQPEKMKLFQRLLEEHFDLARLYAKLGLSPPRG